MEKKCKIPMCHAFVWRTGNFTWSEYCWKHDPEVIEAISANKSKDGSDD